MVTKLKKEETVAELKDMFSKATAVYATQQVGLSDTQVKDLRRQLLKIESELKVAKNTLMRIATKDTQYEPLTKDLSGPTSLVFCYGDPTAPAGKVKTFSKENEDKIKFKGGFLDGEFLDEEKATAVASLPSKDVLLSQIAGLLVGSLSGVAYILQELGNKDDKAKLLKDFIVTDGEDKAEAAKVEAAPESKPEEKAAEAQSETAAEAKGEDKTE